MRLWSVHQLENSLLDLLKHHFPSQIVGRPRRWRGHLEEAPSQVAEIASSWSPPEPWLSACNVFQQSWEHCLVWGWAPVHCQNWFLLLTQTVCMNILTPCTDIIQRHIDSAIPALWKSVWPKQFRSWQKSSYQWNLYIFTLSQFNSIKMLMLMSKLWALAEYPVYCGANLRPPFPNRWATAISSWKCHHSLVGYPTRELTGKTVAHHYIHHKKG